MALSVEEVKSSRQIREFICLPWRIYRSGPNWVPPLLIEEKERFNPRRNPFYRHARVCLFLARNGREAVGRIAAIVNHAHNRFYNDRVGFFGFFEVVENYEAASLLLDAARQWLAAEGMEVMRGPMNFSTNEECGLLISGYDRPPCIMMPYNPPYYVSFLERYGLAKAKDLLAFHFLTSEFTQRVRKMAAWAEKRSTVRIRPINLADFDEEVERVKQVYNSAWEANWGFVPMSDEELDHMARRLRRVADPNMILFAEDEGRPVGFALTLPDFNQVLIHLNGRLFPFGLIKALWYQRKITCARVILLGILKEYRQHGIDIRFQEKTCEAGVRRGITEAEMSWVLEDNTRMTHGIKYVGGKVYKTYRVYDGKI